MFTGIVEEIGLVTRIQQTGPGYAMTIKAGVVTEDTKLGDSIAVNGTCLTVTHLSANHFTVGLSPETRRRTNLIYLKEGQAVNLERSLTPTSRMGGHFVQGHIDGVGTLTGLRPEGDALWVAVQTSPELLHYIVPKGFIALDGVSLTVVDVLADSFTVSLIAYTQSEIGLSRQRVGYQINIEVDVLGKYVEKFIKERRSQTSGITMDFLAEHGYRS